MIKLYLCHQRHFKNMPLWHQQHSDQDWSEMSGTLWPKCDCDCDKQPFDQNVTVTSLWLTIWLWHQWHIRQNATVISVILSSKCVCDISSPVITVTSVTRKTTCNREIRKKALTKIWLWHLWPFDLNVSVIQEILHSNCNCDISNPFNYQLLIQWLVFKYIS